MAYDALNRATNVSGPFGVTQAFGYDASDNRVSATDNKGGTTTSAFDGLNRLTSRTLTGTNLTPIRATWSYDAAGDATASTRQSKAGATWVTAATTATAFDALGRLTSQTTTNPNGGTISSYGYAYDAGDRLTGETINGTGRTYSYDAVDQVTSKASAAKTWA